MTPRDSDLDAFLAAAGWGAARRARLAGDASARRYERLERDGARAILMDAPPDTGEALGPFLHVAGLLADRGVAVPRILAQDQPAGFLLLEDFGDGLFARLAEADPAREPELYAAATDLLIHLHRQPLPEGLTAYDPAMMADFTAPAWEWYAHAGHPAPDDLWQPVRDRLKALLDRHAPDCDVVIHRDFHAENLIWRDTETGLARVGVLDFQDALAGHPAYDLVSLLQDARRDLAPGIETAMIARYCTAMGVDADRFALAYALQGVQRHLRILGIFARLSLKAGKRHYVALIPRVWAHLMTDLDRPELAELRALILDRLPAPTDTHLQDLARHA